MPEIIAPSQILPPPFTRRLDRLSLATHRVLGGMTKGERKSKVKGIGMDFADHRQYTRGDELRHVDWNIYGRLDRVFVKVFLEEQDLQCRILLDTSASMQYGEPDKFLFARRLAASLAYIGLKGQDKVSITAFGPNNRLRHFGPHRGRPQIRRMLDFLGGLEAGGETSLHSVCKDFSQRARGRGIAIVISDLLDPAGFEPALRYLVRDTIDAYVFHVLSPEEINPPLNGHLDLVDLETGDNVEITANKRLMNAYRNHLEAFISTAQTWCTRRGLMYSLLRTDMPVEDIVLKQFRKQGLVTS